MSCLIDFLPENWESLVILEAWKYQTFFETLSTYALATVVILSCFYMLIFFPSIFLSVIELLLDPDQGIVSGVVRLLHIGGRRCRELKE